MYKKIALEAFETRNMCLAQEDGGITIVDTVSARKYKTRVHIRFHYEAPAEYHISRACHKWVYEFKDGRMFLYDDNGFDIKVFKTPWVKESQQMQEEFYKKYAEFIPVSSAEFFSQEEG